MNRPPNSKALRKGRHSEPHARYLVTFNTTPPSATLATPHAYNALFSTLQTLESEAILDPIAFVIMPDHVHLLLRLGTTLNLSKTVSRLKFQFRRASQLTPLTWQSGFHDRKLRFDNELHPILHYLYLNPYRAKLLSPQETWPYTHINEPDWTWFQPLLDQACPYPEWLTP